MILEGCAPEPLTARRWPLGTRLSIGTLHPQAVQPLLWVVQSRICATPVHRYRAEWTGWAEGSVRPLPLAQASTAFAAAQKGDYSGCLPLLGVSGAHWLPTMKPLSCLLPLPLQLLFTRVLQLSSWASCRCRCHGWALQRPNLRSPHARPPPFTPHPSLTQTPTPTRRSLRHAWAARQRRAAASPAVPHRGSPP